MQSSKSVAARLFGAFAIVIAIFIAAAALSAIQLSRYNEAVGYLTGKELEKMSAIGRWIRGVEVAMRNASDMLLLEDHDRQKAALAQMRQTWEGRRAASDFLDASLKTPEGRALFKAAIKFREGNLVAEHDLIAAFEAGHVADARAILLQRAMPGERSLMEALEQLDVHEQALVRSQAQELANAYHRSIVLLWLTVLLATAVAATMAVLVVRSLRRPLAHAVAVLAEIEKDHYDSVVTVTSEDETGQVLRALDSMQRSLKERTARERALATENSRVRIALDRSSAATMLADNDGKILYLNDAASELFRRNASEIRTQIPNFDPDQVLGANFDSFHKVPSHQRGLLTSLRSTHTAEMALGAATLRVIASPVVDSSGQRLGTVVNWLDRTNEVSTEKEIQFVVNAAEQGDLTRRIRTKGEAGFFATLAKGINTILDGNAGLVREVKDAVGEVFRSAAEISTGNANLSQRTEQQSSSLEETASSMEQMTSTVRQNADNAAQANQLAGAARAQAEKGGAVVSEAVSAMQAINSSSNQIADIIGVIDEIAFQTNLLALNAAVEAARAGDQGRGFAVVATEVRALASRSAEAAKQIKSLIEDSVSKVEQGSRLVNESGNTLQEIVASVKRVTDIVSEIAAASREQASGIDQVNKAVTEMDSVTQHNAALVEEAAAAAQALSDQASRLDGMMARYKVIADDTPAWNGGERRREDAWLDRQAPAPRKASAVAARSAATRSTAPKARPAAMRVVPGRKAVGSESQPKADPRAQTASAEAAADWEEF
ncbi:MAG: HAMP domain-containing protein [Proteobacteria bacterium]|nr:HAMP domain-containing protein [Pseudomonadota bacterium]